MRLRQTFLSPAARLRSAKILVHPPKRPSWSRALCGECPRPILAHLHSLLSILTRRGHSSLPLLPEAALARYLPLVGSAALGDAPRSALHPGRSLWRDLRHGDYYAGAGCSAPALL